MFRDRRNPALGISRTYGKDRSGFGSSQLGIAGGRPADAILRLCEKNQQRNRRIAASLSPDESASSEDSWHPEEEKGVFDFTSGDSFDNLHKSASFVNLKYTAKKRKKRAPLRNRNARPVLVESSDEGEEDDGSVVEMFPAKKKRKATKKNKDKVAENFAFFEVPKGRTGRKKQLPELFRNATKGKKADTTGGTSRIQASNNTVSVPAAVTKRPRRKINVERKQLEPPDEENMEIPEPDTPQLAELAEDAENQCPAFVSPANLSSPRSSGTPGVPLNAAKALLGRSMYRGPFASTPVEATLRRRHSPFLLSSVKMHRDGREEYSTSAEFASPKLNTKLSSKSNQNVATKSGGSFYSCAASGSSGSDRFVSVVEGQAGGVPSGSSTPVASSRPRSDTPDLFATTASPALAHNVSAVPQSSDDSLKAQEGDRRLDFTECLAVSVDYGDRLNRVRRAEQTFPFDNVHVRTPDKTVACVRQMRNAWCMSSARNRSAANAEEDKEPSVVNQDRIRNEVNSSQTVRLSASGSKTESLFDDVCFEETAARATPRSSIASPSVVVLDVRDDIMIDQQSEPKRVTRRRSLTGVLDRVSPSQGTAATDNQDARSSITSFPEEFKENALQPRVVLERLPISLTSEPVVSIRSSIMSPPNVFTSTQLRMTNTPECLRENRFSCVASTIASPVGNSSFILEHEDGRRTVFVSPHRREVTVQNVQEEEHMSPVFKIPAIPARLRSFVASPMGNASPGRLRHRCSMRLELPKIPIPAGSFLRAVEEDAAPARRTRAQRRESPKEDLGSWVNAAKLLADPDLACNPQEAVRFLTTMSSAHGPFAGYVRELMSKSASSKKIGEGTYGEVFCFTYRSGEKTVVKIAPTDGEIKINEAIPKKAMEMAMEVVITGVLSDLYKEDRNRCSNFVRLQSMAYVTGPYPKALLKLWDEFATEDETLNERPSKLPRNQRYVSMELSHGGEALETYRLYNALQAVSVLQQAACALAVGESSAAFEHRDLHWGNILLQEIDNNDEDDTEPSDFEKFVLDGEEVAIKHEGVRVTLIDYSLSRLQVPGGAVMFNDLEEDPQLFESYDPSEPQFQVYRDMREVTCGNWNEFHPRTNVLWLIYLADKLRFNCPYGIRGKDCPDHKLGFKLLRTYRRYLEESDSAADFVRNYLAKH